MSVRGVLSASVCTTRPEVKLKQELAILKQELARGAECLRLHHKARTKASSCFSEIGSPPDLERILQEKGATTCVQAICAEAGPSPPAFAPPRARLFIRKHDTDDEKKLNSISPPLALTLCIHACARGRVDSGRSTPRGRCSSSTACLCASSAPRAACRRYCQTPINKSHTRTPARTRARTLTATNECTRTPLCAMRRSPTRE